MKKTLKETLKSKKGTIIYAGEIVEVKFDVIRQGGEGICYSWMSVNTADGRRINIRNPRVIGIRVPGVATLAKYSNDGIAKSVFGERVEPDGYDKHGAPSWLLFLGYI